MWCGCLLESSHSGWSLKGCTGRLLRFTNRLLYNVCEPHDYSSAANVLNLRLLVEHKRSEEISFSNGFLINKVDSSSLRLVIKFFGVQHVNQPFHLLFLLPLPTTIILVNGTVWRSYLLRQRRFGISLS